MLPKKASMASAKRRRSVNLLGTSSAESLYTVYFYNVFLQGTSLFNAALHLGTFQNCNFHVVNNVSYGSE